MGTCVSLFASAVPASNMASIDVPRDGALIGLDWSIYTDSPAADVTQIFQVSFGSTTMNVNDSRSLISSCSLSVDLNTSGMGKVDSNKYVSLPDIQVGAGERIYLHGTGDAVTTVVMVILYFDFELDRALARRR